MSINKGCSEEILTITAMLSVENPFYRPKEKAAQADMKKAKFHHTDGICMLIYNIINIYSIYIINLLNLTILYVIIGDHLTLLNVYEAWKAAKFSNPWCFENFLQPRYTYCS